MLLPNEKIEKSIFKDIAYPTYSLGEDYSSNARSYIAKSGKICVLSISAKNVSLTQGQYPTLMTLPEGYRPKYRTWGMTSRLGYLNAHQDIYIEQNGNVIINSGTNISNGNIIGNITYAIE